MKEDIIKEISNFKIKSDECLKKEEFLPVFKRMMETYNKIVEEINRGKVLDGVSIDDLRQAGFRLRSMRKIAIAEGVIRKDEFPEIQYPNPPAVNEEKVNRLTNKLHSLEKALAAKRKVNEKFVNSFPKQVLDFVKGEEARICSEIDAIKKELGKSNLPPVPQQSIIDEIDDFKCGSEEFMSSVISIEKLEDWISRYNEVSKSVSKDKYERVYQAGCKLRSMQKIVMAETGKLISPVVLPTKPEKEIGSKSIIDEINAVKKEIEDELKKVNELASKLSSLLSRL